MPANIYFRKSLHFSNNYRSRLNSVVFGFVKCCSNQALTQNTGPSTKDGGTSNCSKTKWGYSHQENGFEKHDKNAKGLYHLGTINLPQQLERNLNEFLQKFPNKHLVEDAAQLSKHLQNRGRPTERTWVKYKAAKANRKQLKENLKEHQPNDPEDRPTTEDVGILETTSETHNIEKPTAAIRSHLTKKPKIQEYKIIRYQKREAAAYAADRAPASYGATLRVLHEVAKREKDFKPETVLDYGSGVGTATWAAHELWKDSIKIYQCVDVSHEMNETAEYLLRNSDGYRTPHYVPRVYFKEYLPVTDKITYDIVIASYSLSEIPFIRARQEILENLWRKANHFLVIVEKGNNEGFDITMQARDLVANRPIFNTEHQGFTENDDDDDRSLGFVFSPCPHDLECPRYDINTRDHPCNFEQRVQLSFAQRKTSLKKYGYYNELFSYVVLQKGKRTGQELDWARLLRPVRLREKHVICNFCSKNGSLEQKILTKRKDSEIYKCARHRAKWGDLLPIDGERKCEVDNKEKTDT